mmetsp:Transcript_10642/g.24415  ORF Transcript_10642/g.24415 Transcript_10642/m.24415 type:complete len:202 (+) Transcript_10642:229-834(+)
MCLTGVWIAQLVRLGRLVEFVPAVGIRSVALREFKGATRFPYSSLGARSGQKSSRPRERILDCPNMLVPRGTAPGRRTLAAHAGVLHEALKLVCTRLVVPSPKDAFGPLQQQHCCGGHRSQRVACLNVRAPSDENRLFTLFAQIKSILLRSSYLDNDRVEHGPGTPLPRAKRMLTSPRHRQIFDMRAFSDPPEPRVARAWF